MNNRETVNDTIIFNFNKVRVSYLLLPLLLLASIALFLYEHHAWSADNYTSVQKEAFIFFNKRLSQLPSLMYNVTQLGDAFIILSLFTILIFYAPRIWESLISASLVSTLLCCPLKWLFKIPRPAAVFEKDSFAIIGNTYSGSNSLPSGHAITIFTSLTVLLLALMPKNNYSKALWIVLITGIGLLFALSRVGVGAHYPLDVVIGSIIGYISGVSGILVNRYFKLWTWIGMKQYYPLLIILFLVCCIIMIQKMRHYHLAVFYFSLLSLLISIYILSKQYVKK